ncbi:MAG TPA: hypothetical protein VGS15_06065 [Candidatus Acidoferrales bacterium]|nr:hypothetical protein [Candidatus Acidoferrales bacterium]
MLPPDAIPNQLLYGLFSPSVNAPFAVLVGVCIPLKLSFRARQKRQRPAQLCPADFGANGLDIEGFQDEIRHLPDCISQGFQSVQSSYVKETTSTDIVNIFKTRKAESL